MKKHVISAAVILVVAFSCNKTEGPGGTSSISGTVTGSDYDSAETEITEIVMSAGAEIEHGEYWIINTPGSGTYYYVWYDNPTWVSNGDPGLEGRTGIAVSFNYSDSNLEVAANTLAAIEPVLGNDFTIGLTNDVLMLTNKTAGYVPDGNNMTSPFEFNIAQQGKDATMTAVAPLADERVYLVYGQSFSDHSGGETTRTNGNGEYTFTNLTKGSYIVYVLSEDTLTNSQVKPVVMIDITANKSAVDAGNLHVFY